MWTKRCRFLTGFRVSRSDENFQKKKNRNLIAIKSKKLGQRENTRGRYRLFVDHRDFFTVDVYTSILLLFLSNIFKTAMRFRSNHILIGKSDFKSANESFRFICLSTKDRF